MMIDINKVLLSYSLACTIKVKVTDLEPLYQSFALKFLVGSAYFPDLRMVGMMIDTGPSSTLDKLLFGVFTQLKFQKSNSN